MDVKETNEFEKGYEQGYKDGTAGAALPNVNDNGDKIDGYSYAYKTDSNGETYIHIDSVRGMLKDLREQIAEYKRLLKAAVEGYNFIGHITKDYSCPSATSCSACPMDEGKQCRIWEHADEALALIGEEGGNNA